MRLALNAIIPQHSKPRQSPKEPLAFKFIERSREALTHTFGVASTACSTTSTPSRSTIMGGHKKKNKKGGGGKAKQGGTGSLASTSSAGANSMVHGVEHTAGAQLQTSSNVTGDTATTSATNSEGLPDAIAHLRLDGQGGGCAATSKQVQGRGGGKGKGTQSCASKSPSATSIQPNTTPSSGDFNAKDLVDKLNRSNGRVAGVLLQKICTLARSCDEHKSALLGAGVLPALLRLAQSKEPVSETLSQAMLLFTWMPELTICYGEATNLIRQMVPLVRNRNALIQCMALGWLSNLTTLGRLFCRSMVAAGAIPAVTEALRADYVRSQIQAAFILVEVARVPEAGMGLDTALAAAIPVAISALECGEVCKMEGLSPVYDQQTAAFLLIRWASRFKKASSMAVQLDVMPAVVPVLCSPDTLLQLAGARLLSTLLDRNVGVQAAVEAGAIPAVVQLRRSRDQHIRAYAADALQVLVEQRSQAPLQQQLLLQQHERTAAAAIKPLLSMSGDTSIIEVQQTVEYDLAQMEFYCGPLKGSPTSKGGQAAVLECLLGIVSEGDVQLHKAMVAAGATAALLAPIHSPHQQIREVAREAFQALLVHKGVRKAVAVELVSLMRSQRNRLDQLNAVAVPRTASDDSFRVVLLEAGALAALQPLLVVGTDPELVKMAAASILVFAERHHHAVVKAGVIPLLAQQLLITSCAQMSAALLLLFLGEHDDTHDNLAEVVPQILQAMQVEDTRIHRYIGRLLQRLVQVQLCRCAEEQNASVARALHAAAPQWKPLLGSSCSDIQRHAAGAIYGMFLLGNDDYTCSQEQLAMFRSIRHIFTDEHVPMAKCPRLFNPDFVK